MTVIVKVECPAWAIWAMTDAQGNQELLAVPLTVAHDEAGDGHVELATRDHTVDRSTTWAAHLTEYRHDQITASRALLMVDALGPLRTIRANARRG